MGVEIDVTYEGDLHCTAAHGPSKQRLMTDAPVDNGGRGEAFSPTDLVATGLGTCAVTIMGLVAKRQGWNVVGARIHVVKEMTAAGTRRIASLKATVTLPPTARLSDDDRKRLEQAVKSCPVKQSLHPDVQVTMEFIYPSA